MVAGPLVVVGEDIRVRVPGPCQPELIVLNRQIYIDSINVPDVPSVCCVPNRQLELLGRIIAAVENRGALSSPRRQRYRGSRTICRSNTRGVFGLNNEFKSGRKGL